MRVTCKSSTQPIRRWRTFAGPAEALELSRIANDEMAELVSRFPERFVGAAACLPMNDVDGALGELDRAVQQLGFRAVQIYTDVKGQPLDDPAFAPLFDRVAELDIPILLTRYEAPTGRLSHRDASRFDTWRIIGWLYDTVSAMTRLVFSGLFDRHPDIKIVTHHLGGSPRTRRSESARATTSAQGRSRQK